MVRLCFTEVILQLEISPVFVINLGEGHSVFSKI